MQLGAEVTIGIGERRRWLNVSLPPIGEFIDHEPKVLSSPRMPTSGSSGRQTTVRVESKLSM